MAKFRLVNICLVLLLAIGMSQCASTRSAHTVQTQNSAKFSAALNRASQSSQADEFSTAFKSNAKLTLPSGRIRNLNRFNVGHDGTMLIVDLDRIQVENYDNSGKFIRSIGAKGGRPGEYTYPSDAVEMDEQTVAVSDFQNRRVNIYSQDGQFLRSFIYTPQIFSAQRLLYDDATKSFYLFGNRWQTDDDGKPTGAQLIHKYSAEGDFVASFLPFPDKAKPLDLYTYDEPSMSTANGNVFVALPFDYTIYQLTSKGELSTYLSETNSSFKAPSEGFEVASKEGGELSKRLQDWQLTWTPIRSLIVHGDKLLVQYQTFNPLRYTIDIWSLATKNKLSTVHTNHALLTSGQDRYLYFLDNLDARGQEQYGIIRATLELPQT